MEKEAQTVQRVLPGAHVEKGDPQTALVPSPANLSGDFALLPEAVVGRIPIEIDVAIPIKGFKVASLLALSAGDVVESRWAEGEDMPLGARGAPLAWTEFEVIDEKLAVRITRLA